MHAGQIHLLLFSRLSPLRFPSLRIGDLGRATDEAYDGAERGASSDVRGARDAGEAAEEEEEEEEEEE